ncbi:MAG: DUF4340 domain-containing protein [Myxococcaceae bacterium]|nr:DUF4340 domain-containing protein [Myxococcaceae bacterium]
MKARSAAIQGALAVAGLVAAYVTWQRPEEEKGVEVVVLDLAKKDIQRLRYEDARREVEVVRDSDGLWIRTKDKPPPPPPAPKPPPDAGTPDAGTPDAGTGHDGGTTSAQVTAAAAQKGTDGGVASPSPAVATATPPPPPPPPKTREFRANEAAENLFERFAPLQAVRGLGVLGDEKLKELGLADTPRTIEVVTSRGTHRFRVADEVAGIASPYLRSEDDQKVYLMKATLISDLEYASSRLVDRRLHTFRDDEWDAITVSADGKKRTLTKENGKLTDAKGSPPDQLATNWQEKIWRMIGVEVLSRGEDPAAGKPEVKLRVDYLSDGRPVGFIELAQAGNDTFARTEHTAGWVRLHGGAADIVRERESVLGK